MEDDDCLDSIKDCKKPVKFVSKSKGCYTFACEAKTAREHNIHTRDQSNINKLLQMEKESDKGDFLKDKPMVK
jgi:hypothetical protein